MTVAIPEAAAARSGAVARQGTRQPARQSRPTPAQMGRAGAAGAVAGARPRGPQRAAQGRAGGKSAAPSRRAPVAVNQQKRGGASKKGGRGKGAERRRELARRVSGAATRPGSAVHNYQAIVAAEFVAASLLVALTPIAARKPEQSPVSGQLSPYVPGDLVQLVAIGVVYLILEGLAAGPRGAARFAAWFGFLILLGVGLFEATRIAKVFQMLTGGGISTVVLTGAQAPATKGESAIPPLVPGGAAPTAPPPPKKKPGG